MDTGTPQRTYLDKWRGLFFLLLGTAIVFVLFVSFYLFKLQVSGTYSKNIDGLELRFKDAENRYVAIVSNFQAKKEIDTKKLSDAKSIYGAIKSELVVTRENLFNDEESVKKVDSALAKVAKRLAQIEILYDTSNLVNLEQTFYSQVKTHDSCIDKINYKANPSSISDSIDACLIASDTLKQTYHAIDDIDFFVCENTTEPSTFVETIFSADTYLKNFYIAVAQKNYVEVNKNDVAFKAKKTELSKMNSQACFTQNYTKLLVDLQ